MFTVFVLGSLFIVYGYAKPQGGHVYDAETDCFMQHPSVTRDWIEDIKRTKKLPDNSTEDFKCFIACVGKQLGLMSHNGELNFHELKNVTVDITAGDVSHDDARSMVSKCIDVDHDDHCEKAYKYVECKIGKLTSFTFSKDFCPTCTR